jgi:hypothetical protein
MVNIIVGLLGWILAEGCHLKGHVTLKRNKTIGDAGSRNFDWKRVDKALPEPNSSNRWRALD